MTPLGPVMLDVAGTRLAAQEREKLRHPLAGGVILFARNYESPAQLRELTGAIRAAREPQLLIAVDHEGGRVQRFREGYTTIPPMRAIGAYAGPSCRPQDLARSAALTIAAELQAHGVDFSFSPVLDIDFGASSVIGDRAFSQDAEAVARLAEAFVDGLEQGGMAGVGKHYPGHGHVTADSHTALPVDERDYEVIAAHDLLPYRRIAAKLGGVMPAHVVYEKVDARPAGFSPVWLKSILRTRLGFGGMVFTDDLSMEGAGFAGGMVDRAQAALEAGCDMLLVCNAPADAACVLDGLRAGPVDERRAARMRGRRLLAEPRSHPAYAQAVALLEAVRRAA